MTSWTNLNLIYNQRHNELRDLEAEFLDMLCNYVKVEPALQGIPEEELARTSMRGGSGNHKKQHSSMSVFVTLMLALIGT